MSLPRQGHLVGVVKDPRQHVLAKAVASPSPPQPLSPGPLAWQDSGYYDTVDAINRGRDSSLGVNEARRGAVRRQIGVDQGFRPGEEGADPYSQMAQLKDTYEARKRGTVNSYAARGQLYAGSLTNARSYDRDVFDKGADALTKQQDEQFAALSQSDNDLRTSTGDQMLQAQQEALNRALANRPDPLTTPVAAPAKKKKRR